MSLCLAAGALLLAAEPTAKDLFRKGRKAERAGEIVQAYILYSEAAAKAPSNAEYRTRADALQIRAALKAHAMPSIDKGGHAILEPTDVNPSTEPKPPTGFSTNITEEDMDELRRLKPPPSLNASTGTKTLDLVGNARTLFEKTASAFGLGVAFDTDFESGPTRRLHLDNVDYRQALRAVQAATGTFVFPVGQHLIMAVKDTQQKRKDLEPTVAVTIPIPYALTPQDAQEVGRAVQQALDITKLSIDTNRRLVLIRDRISKVRPAQALFEQLSHKRAQVMIELQFLEVDRASLLSYGLLVPNKFPIPFIGAQGAASVLTDSALQTLVAALGTAIPLAKVANLNPIMFGLGIANAPLFGTMTKSSSQTLLDTAVRSLDGSTANFHVGARYPILNSQFIGGLGASTAGTSVSSLTQTPSVSQTQTPSITSVQWLGNPGNYTLVLTGSGFGASTVLVPFTGNVANFAIQDDAQQTEWGYTGDASALTYQFWSDSNVAVSGFGGQPGDAVVIALWNSSSQAGVTWAGNVPTSTAVPQITSVQLTGSGQSTQIVVQGSGFGAAPSTMPAAGDSADLNFFRFRDFRSHCSGSAQFEAGFGSDPVTLNYQSWSDSEIVISGFGGAYGEGCAVYQSGDPVAITVWNTAGVNLTGPQTAWANGSTSSSSGGGPGTVPLTPVTGLAAIPSFTFEDLGLVMKVTPHIHGTEEVTLDVNAEFKVLTGQSANGIPVIANRKLESRVRIRDGEWAVVAGLMTLSQAKTLTGTPGLSQIPAIGRVFSDNERNRSTSDVILLLRPILLDAPPDASLVRQLWLGSETRLDIPL